MYIPQMFQENNEMEIARQMVQQALYRIENALGKADREKEIKELENRILDTIRPLCFDNYDSENYQVQAERSFEELCAVLSSKGIHNPHDLPALQFYLNIQILTKKKGPTKSTGWEELL